MTINNNLTLNQQLVPLEKPEVNNTTSTIYYIFTMLGFITLGSVAIVLTWVTVEGVLALGKSIYNHFNPNNEETSVVNSSKNVTINENSNLINHNASDNTSHKTVVDSQNVLDQNKNLENTLLNINLDIDNNTHNSTETGDLSHINV